MSMFSRIHKENPCKTIDDCVKEDALTNTLWGWAHVLQILGVVAMILLLVVGIVQSILEGITPGYLLSVPEFSFGTFILTLLPWLFYAFFTYCGFHVLAALVGALAGIYQNTKQTARLTELKLRMETKTTPAPAASGSAKTVTAAPNAPHSGAASDTWTCKSCGTENPRFSFSCSGCGKDKS